MNAALDDRERLIRKISTAIHSSLDSDMVLQTIVTELGTAIGVCRCRMALFTETPLPDELPITHEYIAACCAHRTPLPKTIFTKNNPAFDWVLSSEAPFAVTNTFRDPKLGHLTGKYTASKIHSLLSHAIRLDGKPIGIFSLHKCEEYAWQPWEVEVVQAVTEQAAVAIRQAQLYKEATEAATRAKLVNQIVASIHGSLNLDVILQTASYELGRALGANRAYFCALSPDEANIVAQYVTDPALHLRSLRVEPNNYIVEYLTTTRQTLVIDNLQQFLHDHPEILARVEAWQHNLQTKAVMDCPIFVDDKLWGLIVISQTDHPRKWSKYEIELVEAVKAQVEIAIKHCQLFEEAQQAMKVEGLIRQITQSINQTSRLQDIYRTVALELGNCLAVDALIISRLDTKQQRWNLECAYRQGLVYTPSTSSYSTAEIQGLTDMVKDGFAVCNDVEQDSAVKPYLENLLRPGQIRAFLTVHLQYPESPTITISALSKRQPRRWTEQEKIIMRAAVIQMINAVQRAELFEQVSRGKDQWESTFDALNDGLMIFDKNGLLSRANEAAAALEGAAIVDLIGRQCCTLMQPIESESCKVMQVIDTGIPVTFDLTPEKLSRPVLITISPIRKNFSTLAQNGHGQLTVKPETEVSGAVCIIRDLSELRAAEASARAQRNFLVKLIEHANDVIFALSTEGKLIWCNEQFVRSTGVARKDLFEFGYLQFVAPHNRTLMHQHFQQAVSGEPQTVEMKTVNRAGDERLLLVTFTPIFDEGRITSLLLIARDITEEKLASERAAQAEKMRALGQITAGVAHNFNNILAAILGHAQLLKRNAKDERLAAQAGIIERAALDGAEMVKRIQSFGNQQKDTGYEFVDINQLVQDSINLTKVRWQDEAQARGIFYEVASDLKPLPIVRGSSSEIREVFVNMMLNSLDAMAGGGLLHISTSATKEFVAVQFMDSGVGMNDDVRRRIFEPFFTTKGPSGTGLGLAVSYSAIERHGGNIEVESILGQGTTFTITLPVADTKNAIAPPPEQQQDFHTASMSILVIDDDHHVRSAMVGMLNSLGYRAEEAEGGAQALARMERESFELVLTDLSMPGMDGWAVAAEVRRRWPQIKVVMITGYRSTDQRFRDNMGLLHDIISKPVRLEELSLKINQLITKD
ncbi:MAG: GAF domain-containing protein [Acidobacteria bacterium]|nr:GAF domain-containing protein [Acidobacteriota bacterium]